MLRPLVLSLLLLLPITVAATSAVVTRSTSLQSEPYSDAATVTALAQGASIRLLERRGGWYRARVAGAEGWVRLASVRLEERRPGDGETGLGESLRFVSTGRSGSRSSHATTGVRGLDKQALAVAKPNRAALAELDQYAVDADGARRFARRHGLKEAP